MLACRWFTNGMELLFTFSAASFSDWIISAAKQDLFLQILAHRLSLTTLVLFRS